MVSYWFPVDFPLTQSIDNLIFPPVKLDRSHCCCGQWPSLGATPPANTQKRKALDRVPHIWDGGSNPTECIYNIIYIYIYIYIHMYIYIYIYEINVFFLQTNYFADKLHIDTYCTYQQYPYHIGMCDVTTAVSGENSGRTASGHHAALHDQRGDPISPPRFLTHLGMETYDDLWYTLW